jgi:two-component system NtrC family sensor kinase
MAISYRIVQEHGGSIDVTSRVGEGTAITVSLPIARASLRGYPSPVAGAATMLS